MIHIIPAGSKGARRGNKFNNIIKNHILNLKLDENIFEIDFEKNCPIMKTDEKPDWYVYDKINKKSIIGMNQLDLWGGGAQLNRGFKYINDNKCNTKNCKLLCVVCNYTQLKSKNKKFNLLNNGFKNDTLCYINNLETIIKNFFDIK